MQFRVPQFTETEDKVIGPLTLKQFGYLSGAAILSGILYVTVKAWLWFLGSLIAISIGIGFAFIKINGRPVSTLVLAGAHFYWKPRRYVWQTPQTTTTEPHKEGLSFERLIQGLALKRAWRYVQTGSKTDAKDPGSEPRKDTKERFQLFHSPTGEHRIIRRVDYM